MKEKILCCCLLLSFSCSRVSKVLLFNNNEALAHLLIDEKYGYAFKYYLTSNLISDPDKQTLRASKIPDLYFKKNIKYLITYGESLVFLVSIADNPPSIPSPMEKREITWMDHKYLTVSKLFELKPNQYLVLDFLSMETEGYDLYFEDYIAKISSSVTINIAENVISSLKNNVYSYMFEDYLKHGHFIQGVYFMNKYKDSLQDIANEITMYNSFNGNFNLLKESFKEKRPKNIDLRFIDAEKHIEDISEAYDIILFNEEHNDPYCRFFVRIMLASLKKKGYTALGIETLSYINHDINKYGYPIHGSGFYSDEPHMANLIREAHRLGFEIFPYEAYSYECDTCASQTERMQYRETNQAKSILEKCQEYSKVIIVAGHGHIYKKSNSEVKTMAQVLIENSDYKILSINQTYQTKHPLPTMKMDVIPVTADGKYYVLDEFKDKYDLQVVHNGIHHFNNLNDLSLVIGSQASHDITLVSDKVKYILIYSKSELDAHQKRTIPITSIFIEEPKKSVKVTLNVGTYQISQFDEMGVPLRTENVHL